MTMAEPTPVRSRVDRGVRRARWVAAGLQSVALVLMWAGIWGAPIRAVLVTMRADSATWGDPWQVWAMAEWSVACLAGSYLLWSAADVLRDEFPA